MTRAAHAAEMLGLGVLIVAIVLLAIGSVSPALGATTEPPASLAGYRCYDCHADREALAGPAFAEVAARYRGRQDALATIAAEIRSGIRGGGPWHMPPHPEVSPSEAKAMARYILSLDVKKGRSK